MILNPVDFSSPAEAASAVRNYAGKRVLELGAGDFNFSNPLGMNWHMPPGTVLVGRGPGVTRLLSNVENWTDGACFQLADGVLLRNLSLEFVGPFGGAAVLCGWCGHRTYNRCTARLEHVRLKGAQFGLYSWTPGGNRIIVSDFEIDNGRWGVLLGCSASGDCGFIDLHRGWIHGYYADCANDPCGGQGARMHGISARGGRLTADRVRIDLTGSPDAEHVRGVWMPSTDTTQGDREAGHPDAVAELNRVDVRIVPAGAANWCDLESHSGWINSHRGTGSLDGQIKLAGNVRLCASGSMPLRQSDAA